MKTKSSPNIYENNEHKEKEREKISTRQEKMSNPHTSPYNFNPFNPRHCLEFGVNGDLCPTFFKHTSSLVVHMFQHHGLLLCAMCGKSYRDPQSFENHVHRNDVNIYESESK